MFLLTRCMYLQILLSARKAKSIIFLAGRFKETPCLLSIISSSLLHFPLWLYHKMPFYEICNQLKTHEFFTETLPLHAHSSSFRCYSNAKLYTYMFKFICFIHTLSVVNTVNHEPFISYLFHKPENFLSKFLISWLISFVSKDYPGALRPCPGDTGICFIIHTDYISPSTSSFQ